MLIKGAAGAAGTQNGITPTQQVEKPRVLPKIQDPGTSE